MNGPKPALQSLIEEVLYRGKFDEEPTSATFDVEEIAHDIVLAIQRAGGIKAFMEGHSAPDLVSYTLHYYYVGMGERFDLLDTQTIVDCSRIAELPFDDDRMRIIVLQKEA